MMFSLLFGVALVLLLTQAFKLMRQGMDAANRPMDTIPKGSDRTGIRTIHPEMLDRNNAAPSREAERSWEDRMVVGMPLQLC